MFSVIIGEVDLAWCPLYFEHFLADSVAQPVEAHVDGFAATLFHCAVHDAVSGAVVGSHGGCWLWVS